MLSKYLPSTYNNSQVMHDLLNVVQIEIDSLNQYIEHQKEQMSIVNATDGLEMYEEMLGVNDHSGDTYELRRKRCITKLLSLKYASIGVLWKLGELFDISINIDEPGTLLVETINQMGIPIAYDEINDILNKTICSGVKVVWFLYLYPWYSVKNKGAWSTQSTKTWNKVLTTE